MEQETASAGTGSPDQDSNEVTGPAGPRVAEAATGEPRVDVALSLLDRLPELPVSEHPQLFEHVHERLGEILGELDSGLAAGSGQADH